MGGSNKSSGATTTTQTSEPWAGQKPYLSDLYAKAQTAANQTNRTPYAGDIIAGPNQTQLGAVNLAKQKAGQATNLGAIANSGADYLANKAKSGNYVQSATAGNLNMPEMNIMPVNLEQVQGVSPVTQGAINSAINPLQQRLMEQILPGIESAAIEGGAFGGSRMGVIQGQALNDFTKNAQDIAASYAYDDLARRQGMNMQDVMQQRELGASDTMQQRDLMLQDLLNKRLQTVRGQQLEQTALGQAAGLQGQGFQQGLLPVELLQNAGGMEQAWSQDTLDEAMQRYNMKKMAPWTGLGEYAGIVQGGFPGGSSTVTGSQAGPSTASRLLSGGVGGGLLGGMLAQQGMFGAGAAASPWGFPLLAGAALGGLTGIL